MNTELQKPIHLSRWIAYNIAGWILGIVLLIGFASVGELVGGADIGGQAAIGIGMGTGVGFMQWRILKNEFPSPQKWLWFSIFGFSFSYILFDVLSLLIPMKPEIFTPFATAIGAILTGWLQYKYVLEPVYMDSKKWMYFNFSGWVLAHLLTFGFVALNLPIAQIFPRVITIILAFLFILIGGPIYAYITGRGIIPILSNKTV